jgi:hypothetical protein
MAGKLELHLKAKDEAEKAEQSGSVQ